jgi:hypothetical protein
MGIDHSAYKVPGREVDAAARNALMDDLTAYLAG